MKCKESSIVKTEMIAFFEKKRNFVSFFLAVIVKDHKENIKSDNIICENNTCNC